MIKILFVCHGNICRSTMAESVFTHMVKERKIENQFEIFSAGTSREEIGNPVHYGTVNKLKELSIPVVPHRAVQMTKEDLEYYDYIIAMDDNNIRNIERIIGGKNEKVKNYYLLLARLLILLIRGIQRILIKLMKILKKV